MKAHWGVEPALDKVNVQLYASAALPRWKDLGIHCVRDWVHSRVRLDAAAKIKYNPIALCNPSLYLSIDNPNKAMLLIRMGQERKSVNCKLQRRWEGVVMKGLS
jgi:hypothetical protein